MCTATTPVENGMFVVANWSNNTVAPCGNRTHISYFVENVIDTVDEQQIDDLDYKVAVGKHVRMKRVQTGEVFVTDQVHGTVNVNDILDAHDQAGKLSATSATPVQKYQVIEKPTLHGKTFYRCLAL
jgi:hypothetical protein